MKKMKKGSKGFTLTELAIVIAVIAILIAVLVPTFVSLINKAEESSDVVTVRNMNTVLSTETDDIDKPTDALKIVYEEGGYSVANMTPKSTGKIVYDELTSSFVFVYSDGTTYPEDTTTKLTAYTTWELVSTSDIEPDDNGAYHFEDSDYANNSIILKGSDWAGKTVYAKYGVELWNDNDTSTTLSGLYIENTDTEVQNVVAEAGSISLAKSAIKTAGSADSTRNIIVNVKTNYLTYSTKFYNISDHSTVNATLTTDGNGTYYQYGTSAGYDFTKKGGNIVVCNETQAENIKSNNVVIIVDTNDNNSTSVYLSDSTDTLTVTAINEEVETFSVNLNTESITLTVTDTGSVQVTYTNTDTGLTVEVDLSDDEITSMTECKEAITTGFGTVDYPYFVSTYSDLVEKVKSDCYIQLVADIPLSNVLTVNAGITITLDMAGYDITQSASYNTIENKGNLTITNSTNETSIIKGKSSKTTIKNTSNVLTLKNITVEGPGTNSYGILYVYGGEANVDNCIFNSGNVNRYLVCVAAGKTLTISKSTYADGSKNKKIKMAGEGSICIADDSVTNATSSTDKIMFYYSTTSYSLADEAISSSTTVYTTVTGYVAYIGSTSYTTLSTALKVAASNGGGTANTVTLSKSCNYYLSTNSALASGKELIVDLNGYTITLKEGTATAYTVSDGTSISFKNGTITKSTSNAFTVEEGSSLILDDVDLTTGGYGVYVRGEGASVTVTNSSTITAETFAVSTNAATSDYYNVAVTIEDSTLYAKCGILFNVPGSLTISGSTVTGGVQAVIVRAGTATISNSTLKSELTDNSNWSRYDDENWGDGNGVAYAVLVIGNKNGTYAGDAQVTIDNVIFAYDTTAGSENGVYIYMYGGVVYNTTDSEEPNKAILYYDSASVTEIITKGSNDYIEIIQSAD